MSLTAQTKISQDSFLIERIAAGAAFHGVRDARTWAASNIWLFSAQPGWAEAYNKALEDTPGAEDPANWAPEIGKDNTVITDDMIRNAVNKILTETVPDPTITVGKPSENTEEPTNSFS